MTGRQRLRAAAAAAADLALHPDRAMPAAVALFTLLVVSGIGFAAVGRSDSPAGSSPLAATDGRIRAAHVRAAGGDALGAADGLLATAPGAAPDARARLRTAAAGLLVDASGSALGRGDARAAVIDADRAVALGDTAPGTAAAAQLPGLLVDAARTLVGAGDTGDAAAAWLQRAERLGAGTTTATDAAAVLAEPVRVTGVLAPGGSPVVGADVLLVPEAAAPSAPATARARTAADGSFDLGRVPPGVYRLSWLAGDTAHPLAPITVSAARASHLVLDT